MSTINLGLSDGRIKVYVNKELYGDDRVIYTEIRKAVDYIFDYNASKAVFGETNALADVNGKPYIEVFLSAILPVIKEHITSYGKSAKKRVDAVESYIK